MYSNILNSFIFLVTKYKKSFVSYYSFIQPIRKNIKLLQKHKNKLVKLSFLPKVVFTVVKACGPSVYYLLKPITFYR